MSIFLVRSGLVVGIKDTSPVLISDFRSLKFMVLSTKRATDLCRFDFAAVQFPYFLVSWNVLAILVLASGFELPVPASGFQLLALGFWLLASGFRLPASSFRLLASGFWLLAP